ncbi:uncharacterized protein K460DRAFT_51841 [Cucurbitaria berberidis CBS 394.84]|uniref:Uncharacterized protein n=1 Tax=Cucurbitaria berberidis CBS 394.84 TaxID=1168544 RepID=A0A9P4GIW7_9PLEO|nr:uncharacterized protein K460DRAFT_51841 [Cucurbitaria berberidis CBS 394.84]KAF1847018.1 hypothetical protein K460DRAFT_51841 [Cucurbitaria berberidis CBS 394.84]
MTPVGPSHHKSGWICRVTFVYTMAVWVQYDEDRFSGNRRGHLTDTISVGVGQNHDWVCCVCGRAVGKCTIANLYSGIYRKRLHIIEQKVARS